MFLGFKFELIWVDLERIGLDWIWCMFCGYDLVSCDWVWGWIWFGLTCGRRRVGDERGGTIRKMGSETMCLYECQSRKLGRPFKDQHCFSPQACPVPKDIFIRLASWQGRSQAQRNFQTHLACAWNHIERHLWTLCFIIESKYSVPNRGAMRKKDTRMRTQ